MNRVQHPKAIKALNPQASAECHPRVHPDNRAQPGRLASDERARWQVFRVAQLHLLDPPLRVMAQIHDFLAESLKQLSFVDPSDLINVRSSHVHR
ncbi:hypothetical protein D9M68_995170 [compost metagenome]